MPNRRIIIVGDGAYTCYDLLDAVKSEVCMITPLRLDARLFDLPAENPAGKPGPKPKIGERQLSLEQRLTHPQTQWQEIVIPNWCNEQYLIFQTFSKSFDQIFEAVCIWHFST